MKDVLEQIVKKREERKPGVLVMVVEHEENLKEKDEYPIGSKMVLWEGGETFGSIGGGLVESAVVKKAQSVFMEKKNCIQTFRMDQIYGKTLEDAISVNSHKGIRIYFEYIPVQQKIYIFGSNHLCSAIAYHLAPLDHDVSVFDSKREALDEVTSHVNKFVIDYEKDIPEMDLKSDDMILILTHNPDLEYLVLKSLYAHKTKVRYVGVVSNYRQVEEHKLKIKDELADNIDFSSLYGPCGLEIGGESHHEIAISIVAQIQAVRNGKFSQYLDLL